MHKMLAPVLAGAMVLTGCGEAPRPEWHSGQQVIVDTEFASFDRTFENSVIDTHDRNVANASYDSVRKVLGEKMTAQLVLLSGTDTYLCENNDELRLTMTSLSGPRYCTASKTGSIVMTGVWTSHVSPGFAGYDLNVEDAGMLFIMSHEEAHEQQQREDSKLQDKDRELNADCRAGQYLRDMHITSAAFDQINRYVGGMLTTDFAGHGSPQERQQQLGQGYQQNNCA
jgi:hypothetical protein